MYLVMTLEKTLNINIGAISLAQDDLAGMAPIFKRKKDAVKFAKRNGNTQVLQIALRKQNGDGE